MDTWVYVLTCVDDDVHTYILIYTINSEKLEFWEYISFCSLIRAKPIPVI